MYKALLIPALILTSFLSLTSCSSSDEPKTEKPVVPSASSITISPESLTASQESQQVTFTVNAEVDWNTSSAAQWITHVFPNGGVKGEKKDVAVTITANTGMEPRTGVVKVKSGSLVKEFTLTQLPLQQLKLPVDAYRVSYSGETLDITIDANTDWTATADASWINVKTPTGSGQSICTVEIAANDVNQERTAHVDLAYGKDQKATVSITQYTDAIDVPEGYRLVWNDEFNDDNAQLTSLWSYDVQNPGWVNNELQRYVAGELNGKKTAEIHDGMLTITARKEGSQVISARLNSKEGWTYGIIEARLRLPKGKGTWPAFWMYPLRPDGNWPYCGEIDIMEEVGCVPNEVSSSIHCKAYNHPNNTQKTAARKLADAEEEFHIYRLEWTADYIRTYVDGVQLFNFPNDKKGNRDTWPFDYSFKIILNLAWGGDWGGMWGVDENALPVKYDIDYVRVFQK